MDAVTRAAFAEIARLQEEAIRHEAQIAHLREVVRHYNPDDAIFDGEKANPDHDARMQAWFEYQGDAPEGLRRRLAARS